MRHVINKKTNFILTITTLMLSTMATFATENNQVWIDFGVSGKLTDKITLTYAEELRYKEQGFEYVYHHTDIRLAFDVYPGWKIEPAFRYTEKYKNGENTSMPGIYVNVDNSSNYKEVNIKSRLRVFYGDTESGADTIWVWPKLIITPKKSWTDAKLKPYIAEEIMFDMQDYRLYKNRLRLGITSSPYKATKIGAFIMHEMTEPSKGSSFYEAYNLGLSLFFHF